MGEEVVGPRRSPSSGVLAEAFRAYRDNFGPLIGIALFLPLAYYLALSGLILLVFGAALLFVRQLDPLYAVLVLGFGGNAVPLGMIAVNGVISGAVAAGVASWRDGERVSIRLAYREAGRRWLALFANRLMLTLALVTLALTFIGSPAALWLGVRWALAVPAIVLEGSGPVAAFRRSSRLVCKSWWRTFGPLIVPWLINLGLAGLLGVLSVILSYWLQNPEADVAALQGALLVTLALALLAYPLTTVVATLLYFDLRERKEKDAAAVPAR